MVTAMCVCHVVVICYLDHDRQSCMYVCIYVCMYVCMYIDCCVCICYAQLDTFVVHHAHPPTPPSVIDPVAQERIHDPPSFLPMQEQTHAPIQWSAHAMIFYTVIYPNTRQSHTCIGAQVNGDISDKRVGIAIRTTRYTFLIPVLNLSLILPLSPSLSIGYRHTKDPWFWINKYLFIITSKSPFGVLRNASLLQYAYKNVCTQCTDFGNDFIIVFVHGSFNFFNFLHWQVTVTR